MRMPPSAADRRMARLTADGCRLKVLEACGLQYLSHSQALVDKTDSKSPYLYLSYISLYFVFIYLNTYFFLTALKKRKTVSAVSQFKNPFGYRGVWAFHIVSRLSTAVSKVSVRPEIPLHRHSHIPGYTVFLFLP